MRKPSLTGDRTVVMAVVLATGWLLVMILLDIVLPTSYVPDPLFAIAPLIACSVLSPRVTAAFGAAAVLLLAWSGWWNQTWDTPQQWIRLLDVFLVGVPPSDRDHEGAPWAAAERLPPSPKPRNALSSPPVPPPPGIHTASRYLSAAKDAVVGGNTYDCSVDPGLHPVHRR